MIKQIIKTLILVSLLVLMTLLFYKTYELIPGEKIEMMVIQPDLNISTENISNELEMIIPNMRFNTNYIGFEFEQSCPQSKREGVLHAFNIISSETRNIFFREENLNPQIKVYCNESKKESGENTYIAGEGGPTKLINLSLYPLIVSGHIYLYDTFRKSTCEYPVVEIHELLHVFGFKHINDKNSILYPYLECKQKLDEEIILLLRDLYNIEPASELIAKNIEASKAGIYFNLKIDIENSGLIEAKNIKIVITSDNKLVNEFEVDNLEPGVTQMLNIKNIKLPSRNTNEIGLEIYTPTKEFSKENNFLVVKI